MGRTSSRRASSRLYRIETGLAPLSLLKSCNASNRHRPRTIHKDPGAAHPRLDLIRHDDVAMDLPELTLPHPRLFERAFVLCRWPRIAPDRVIVGAKCQRRRWQSCRRDGIERLPYTD